MGDQFNWKIEEEAEEPSAQTTQVRWTVGSILFWTIAIVATVSLLAGWFITRRESQKGTAELVEATQELLDLGQQAMAVGDGESFFSLQDKDADWFVAQLLPENQVANRNGLQVTNAEQQGIYIWANATWEEQGNEYQRILFFQWRGGQLRQVPSDPLYWGNRLQAKYEWGRLEYPAIDDPWTASMQTFVQNTVTDVCAEACLADRLPFTLEVRSDFRKTAEPGHINIPSPRLLGLDSEGKPSSRFWQELSQRIHAYLTPATIRFAVPPLQDNKSLLRYSKLAEQFMALNPGITIELVELEALPENLSTLALEFDGAAVPPTEAMLAAGQVHDLTDFISSDPDFDKADFYEQIWQGTLWRDRNWFMPVAAEMLNLYYDTTYYRLAGHAEPSSRWTWDEMVQDVSSIVDDQPELNELVWGFLDVGLDSLFSYAYNWNNQCSETATVYCQTPLSTDNVAAALEWYKQLAGQPGQMPDLSGELSDVFSATEMSALETVLGEERQTLLLLNFQGSRRKAAIWVDSPVNYEFNLLLSPVGVVPFPGSDRFDGITPLWLRGGFISQQSERPLAVWQWLKFLSYQSPAPRFIPARPSVAAEMAYWTVLPRPLSDVMRTAFPFARPVTMEELGMLRWDQVMAVVSGELSAEEAAQDQPAIHWFGYDRE
ncbi:MAG: extracellular solute-binding protein [Chloroflexi bacterium]|jgi:ABC-type glycerol-3-phosphate transport system substrate-binding protein|nr:extracellular solute-binding protein [Chloroflexota bacterium]